MCLVFQNAKKKKKKKGKTKGMRDTIFFFPAVLMFDPKSWLPAYILT